jgi:hypothetical protein
MTSQTLNALKGWGTNMHAVDFVAPLDPAALSVTAATRVPAGSVVHVNNSLNFVLGVGNLAVMPMFTFSASDDADVSNDGGDAATVAGAFIAIAPVGNMMALVAVGALELVSTNYNTAGSYTPNTHLTSPTADASGVLAGQLTPGTLGTNTICGVVSRGVTDNGYGTPALAFWPVYLPPSA